MTRISVSRCLAATIAALCCGCWVQAAQDRITAPIDGSRMELLTPSLHPSARPEFDRGPASPDLVVPAVTLFVRPSSAQQAQLDALLADQQDRSKAAFHRWLSPEQFADRFGLSPADAAKVTAWLRSRGLSVNYVARGRHWVTFSGTAATVGAAFHTEIHRFFVDGDMHFANATALSIPAALDGIVGGVEGLNDFRPRHSRRAAPEFTGGGTHSLAPDDLATIYDIGLLYQQGIDGSGQSAVVVGESNISLADTRAFQQEFGLPLRDPRIILFGPDPGVNAGRGEGEGDIQVIASVARNATLLYVYASNPSAAAQYAIDQNLAPVITGSFLSCENSASPAFRVVAQQANAQGITWLAAAGDAGPANCDAFYQPSHPAAIYGLSVGLPASLPEVTAVGGTEFNEGNGTYWSATNSATGSSALSYIPEMAWDDTSPANGIEAGAGGPSHLWDKPAWQSGPGVPNDGARDVPDVSFSASAVHDSYRSFYDGAASAGNSGTSSSSPMFAGIVTLLNQYVSTHGGTSGLGNINPRLYRMAQTTSDVFHDITVGNNDVPCVIGTLDCTTGILGYSAGPGYDLATGLGSLDAYRFVMEWDEPAPSLTLLTANATSFNATGPLQLTASVSGSPSGSAGVPTGAVTFLDGGTNLGSATLNAAGAATIAVADYALPQGNNSISAVYSGDGNYAGSAASLAVTISLPASGSAVVSTIAPNPVYPQAGGDGKQQWNVTVTLQNLTAAGTTLNGFTIDGADYSRQIPGLFGSSTLAGNGSLAATMSFENLAAPLNRVFGFNVVDGDGQKWSQQSTVAFSAVVPAQRLSLVVEPPVTTQNPTADPSCQWAQQLTVQSYLLSGYVTLARLTATGDDGSFDDLSGSMEKIFGTTRLPEGRTLQGTVCWGGTTPPAPKLYTMEVTNLAGAPGGSATAKASFASPSVGNAFTVSPGSIAFLSPKPGSPFAGSTQVQVSCGASSNWSAALHYANVLDAGWLSVVQQPGAAMVSAGFANPKAGVYSARLTIQCPDGLPEVINVPIVLVVGASNSLRITAVANAASYAPILAPGAIMSVFGSGLAPQTSAATSTPLPLTLMGVTAAVNELGTALYYVSPNQLNVQVPYAAGGGPAVLSVNNNGAAAYFLFEISAAAPGIFTDDSGNLAPYPTAAPGQTTTLFLTGDGDERPLLVGTGAAATGVEHPLLPVAVTVAGLPAVVTYSGLLEGSVAVSQVNFTIPASVPPGPQPVVVSIGGFASPAATVNIFP
jgi:uncharacterized protein (TIGR03437 family)